MVKKRSVKQQGKTAQKYCRACRGHDFDVLVSAAGHFAYPKN